jgi:signal transduction histidine kinase
MQPEFATQQRHRPMQQPAAIVPEEDFFVLSSLAPSPAQKRLALVVVLSILAAAILITAGLFSNLRLGAVEAFVPAYTSAMIVNDSITAILLFAQFSILRTRAILVVASGYLFTALILIPWILTFPGAFAPTGLIGGLQSTSGLYFFWHVGFALFVIGYALSKDADPSRRFWQGTVRGAIALSVALTVAAVSAAAFLCVAGEPLLPHVTSDTRRLTSLWPYVVGAPVALVSVAALIVLWVQRRSVLDLWLIVVLVTFAVDPILSYYPVPSRFSAGWYAVRVFGLLSSSVVLLVLLYEITALYAQLVDAVRAQRRERTARLMTGDAVAATMAHEVKQPLSAMITRAETGFRRLDRSPPDLDKAMEDFKQIAADGYRAGVVIESIRANFKKEGRGRIALDLNDLIEETIATVREDLAKHRVSVKAELDDDLPQVMGDRTQLQQVLVNLITNAIDSMAAVDQSRILFVKSELHYDDIRISVADTGTGIDSRDIERIFNPLFTTKSDGMGMGLSICRSIIEAHDGHLVAAPKAPTGAVFQFVLPPRGDERP